jgi:energy-coupling factor transporter ATP-binding protein EcfA2
MEVLVLLVNKALTFIIGESGSGKTTLLEILLELNSKEYVKKDYPTLHELLVFDPYGFRKRELENLYKLPGGALDTPVGKAYQAPRAKYTMGEIMVRNFHFWREVDPYFTTRNLHQEITSAKQWLPEDPNVNSAPSIVGISFRNLEEVKLLIDSFPKYRLVVLEPKGSGKAKTSDAFLDTIRNELLSRGGLHFQIPNDGVNLPKYVESIKLIIKDLKAKGISLI